MNESARQPIPINEKLVWDYDIPADAQENKDFLCWYLSRVLTRGTSDDLRAIGFVTIHAYLPDLNLPPDIRDFWLWYFSQPEVQKRYGITNPISTRNP